jgi:haloacid dehalogenase-like hydrolase
VLLDKTGTVSTGMMAVTGVLPAAGVSREDLLRHAGAVEQASEHPVAAAISAAAGAELGLLPQAASFVTMPGLGARGSVDGHEVVVGRESLFGQLQMTVPATVSGQCQRWEQAGCTTVLAGWDGQVRGAVAVPDAIALARGTLGGDPGQPRLGVRQQRRRDPAGGGRFSQPADRGGGDGRIVSLSGRQQRAAAAVRRPGCPPPPATAALGCIGPGRREPRAGPGFLPAVVNPVEAEEQMA